jgi:hypothetical protein
MKPTRQERVTRLRVLNLSTMPMTELQMHLQALGQSARGERRELIERLHRAIWTVR